jgi:hypothetical protein
MFIKLKKEEIDKINKYFNEPEDYKDNLWIIKPKYKQFDPIICDSYSKCYNLALKQINQLENNDYSIADCLPTFSVNEEKYNKLF